MDQQPEASEMALAEEMLSVYIDTSEIVSGLDRNANQQRAVYNTFLESTGGEAYPQCTDPEG